MKANSTPPQKANPGVLALILVAIILTVIGLYLEDARHYPYGTFGGLIWLAVLAVSFLFGLLFFAQFVLPLGGNEGWSEGLRLLWRHYTDLGEKYFAPKPKPQPRSRRAKKNTPQTDSLGLPASFSGLNAGILKSCHTLALVKGNEFIRSAGPGFVMLYKKEKVSHLIDLRKQLRRQPVKANTRDGIAVTTAVTVIFRVRQTVEEFMGAEPYPFDPEAIFHIAYSHSIDEREAIRGWMDQIAPRAAALLINKISHYNLDILYHPGGGPGDKSILDEIKNNIAQELGRQLDQNGVEIQAIGVDPFTLPEAVTQQRIKTWQAEWERKITLQKAAGDAEVVRRIKRARARAQIEIITNITQNIASVRQARGANLSNIITLRMIEALEEAKSSSMLQSLIPQQVITNMVMDTSEQMQEWLDQPEEEQG